MARGREGVGRRSDFARGCLSRRATTAPQEHCSRAEQHHGGGGLGDCLDEAEVVHNSFSFHVCAESDMRNRGRVRRVCEGRSCLHAISKPSDGPLWSHGIEDDFVGVEARDGDSHRLAICRAQSSKNSVLNSVSGFIQRPCHGKMAASVPWNSGWSVEAETQGHPISTACGIQIGLQSIDIVCGNVDWEKCQPFSYKCDLGTVGSCTCVVCRNPRLPGRCGYVWSTAIQDSAAAETV